MTQTALENEKPKKRLGTVRDVEAVTSLDSRTIMRYADSGRMPWGFKIGAARRWDMDQIAEWISGGCKPVRTAGKAVRP